MRAFSILWLSTFRAWIAAVEAGPCLFALRSFSICSLCLTIFLLSNLASHLLARCRLLSHLSWVSRECIQSVYFPRHINNLKSHSKSISMYLLIWCLENPPFTQLLYCCILHDVKQNWEASKPQFSPVSWNTHEHGFTVHTHMSAGACQAAGVREIGGKWWRYAWRTGLLSRSCPLHNTCMQVGRYPGKVMSLKSYQSACIYLYICTSL